MITNADKILFHPSALGDIYSGVAKGWNVENSLTCKRKLVKIFREIKFGRYYSFSNKYTEKGLKMEEDAITLYSRFKQKLFNKNGARKQNDFFDGEWDILDIDNTVDIKCSWSLDQFPHPLLDKIDIGYELQGRGYMDLTGAKRHTVAYCLVNAPANLIKREKDNLWYQLGCPDPSNMDFIIGKIDIEKNMIFDRKQFISDNPQAELDCKEWTFDIPISERVVEFSIDFDQDKLDKIKSRITDCRAWMNENLFNSVIIASHDKDLDIVIVE